MRSIRLTGWAVIEAPLGALAFTLRGRPPLRAAETYHLWVPVPPTRAAISRWRSRSLAGTSLGRFPWSTSDLPLLLLEAPVCWPPCRATPLNARPARDDRRP